MASSALSSTKMKVLVEGREHGELCTYVSVMYLRNLARETLYFFLDWQNFIQAP